MFYYQNQSGLYPGTPEAFRSLTHAEWVDEMVFHEDTAHATPQKISAADLELHKFLIQPYARYKKSTPKLVIRQGEKVGNHTVYTLENIPKGTVVTEYLGEWSLQPSTRSSYRWGPIDGLRYRNLGGMIEDGFPNIAAFHLYNVRRIPLRVLFIALEDIAAGEMLAIHYGMNHSVKVHYHTEYRLESMKHFFTNNPLDNILLRVKELQNKTVKDLGWKKYLELEHLLAKLHYLFQTPSALLHLLLEDVITPEKIFTFFGDLVRRYYILGFPLTPNYRQKEVIEYISLIEKNFPSIYEFRTIILENIGRLRQRILFKVLITHLIGTTDQSVREANTWNLALDAIYQGDRDLVSLRIEQATMQNKLLQECLLYAREIRSPLLAWLQSITDPIYPLPNAG